MSHPSDREVGSNDAAFNGAFRNPYFYERPLSFWGYVGFLLTYGSMIGILAVFFPAVFNSYLLFEGREQTQETYDALRLRGAVVLICIACWVVSFATRLSIARYVVYFVLFWTVLHFLVDLPHITISDTAAKLYTSLFVLVMRPVVILALMIAAASFSHTVQYERRLWRRGAGQVTP